MPEHRRPFSPQFKAEAVQMVIETGKPIAEVSVASPPEHAVIRPGIRCRTAVLAGRHDQQVRAA